MHDVHATAADDVATIVAVEVDRLLRHHRQVPGLVIRGEELLLVIALVDVLPAAAVSRFHEDGKAKVGEDLVPVHPFHVPERPGLSARRVILVRQEHRARNSDVDRLGDEVVEELVIRGPPDRVVNDLHAGGRRAFEVCPVKRDLVADSIEDQIVGKDAVIFEIGDFSRHGLDPIAATLVDGIDQGPGKGVFHAEHEGNAFLFHRGSPGGGSYRIGGSAAMARGIMFNVQC